MCLVVFRFFIKVVFFRKFFDAVDRRVSREFFSFFSIILNSFWDLVRFVCRSRDLGREISYWYYLVV